MNGMKDKTGGQMGKTSKKPSLADIINEWIGTLPHVKDHLEMTGYQQGCFLDLKCAPKPELGSIAYIGRIPRDETGVEWVHGLNPYEPDFFKKLEVFMIECHNIVTEELGCKKSINPPRR